MKKYVEPEMVARARQMDLLTYLRMYEPEELVKIAPDVYSTRTHDSLKISNGAWMWWSQGYGGYTALDYLIKVKGKPFVDAVELLCGERARQPPAAEITLKMKKTKTKQPLLLPKKASNYFIAIRYLCSRGIDKRIVDECIAKGMIYESLPYHSVIFVGYDNTNTPRYAGFRATNGERVLGDCSGSDKQYSFRLADGNGDSVHLFESAIDLLSFATLLKMGGEDYHKYNMISLSGVYAPSKNPGQGRTPTVLDRYLEQHPNTKNIVIHFDNDSKGRAAEKVIENKLKDRYKVVDFPPPSGKDFNDFLCLYRRKQLSINRYQGR